VAEMLSSKAAWLSLEEVSQLSSLEEEQGEEEELVEEEEKEGER